ncbi:MAG TPA: serine hydrolase [Pseudonocardiaceae bacterium]|nr:serine hydrolase [Pseudonocardiaceae bacterium]
MTRRLRITDLPDLAVPERPAISPDGSRIVYVLHTEDAEADKPVTALWRVNTTGGDPIQLTRGSADSAPAWSPDGRRLAFLRANNVAMLTLRHVDVPHMRHADVQHRRSADVPPQVWVLPADGGEAEPVSALPLGAGTPIWSPDGRKLAFVAPVDSAADAGEDEDARTTRRNRTPIVTDRLDYQSDGGGLLRTVRRHLHVLDLDSDECRQVTEGDWDAIEPAWSPDGNRIAFAAGMAPDADLTNHVGVHVIDVTSPGNRPELVGFATGMAQAITWSADGDTLLVVGVPGKLDGPSGLFRLPATGAAETPAAELTNLAAPLDRGVNLGTALFPGGTPQLVDGGAAVIFSARDRGSAHLYRVGVDGGMPQLVLGDADQVVSGLSVSGSLLAAVLVTATSFGEVVTVDLGTATTTVRTRHGANLADVERFVAESRDFTISDGTVVHARLIRDPDRTGPLPMLLDIHGGPHGAWHGAADAARTYQQELVARGWAVLLVNPRASDGYGAAFHTATAGDWGSADAKDFLEPIDTLVAEGVVDADRLAVTGYSYGGYLTCYLTSHDQRFAAAVAGGVVSDLATFAGTSDIGHAFAVHEFGALPWRDPEKLAAHSPISRVSEVRTPTLVVHGTEDLRCPIGQGQQWYTALRERGVPTEFVLYPGGSHVYTRKWPLSQVMDLNRRVVDWVLRYAADPSGPRPSRLDQKHWQRRLDTLARRHNVPGAQLGILRIGHGDDDLVTAAHGVLNTNTGVTTTTDSLFQIGSITKVWTTTLIMQLVDEGRLDLDAPVVDVLPELRLPDPETAKQLTVRHLLTHTSGIDGDLFTDAGRGDDCLERFVALLADVPPLFPLATIWSYSNAGFIVVGRIIEKITGQTWDAVLNERLLRPLGLSHTVTLPEEAVLHRVAVGHVGGPEPEPVPVWTYPRSHGPVGLINSTVADQLAFARLHLTGGLTEDGTRLLSAESAAAMTDKHADLPDLRSPFDSWGLGWARINFTGHRLVGHTGGTPGQSAFLYVLPEQDFAVALFANGGNTGGLYRDLFEEIFAELVDVAMTPLVTPPAEPVTVDITPWLGTYERGSFRLEVLDGEDGPMLRVAITGSLAEIEDQPVRELNLVAVEPGRFVARAGNQGYWTTVLFDTLPDGTRYVHYAMRGTPKVA